MHVLYLTTEFPWPAISGGRVRSLADLRLIASLPEVLGVDLVCLEEEPTSSDDIRALASELPKLAIFPPVFHPIHLKKHPAWLPLVAALRLVPGLPYLAGKWVSPRVARALRRVVLGRVPDLVYIDHLGMAVYERRLRRWAPRARFVLGQHNVESDFFAQFAAKKSGLVRRLAELETRLARRVEIDVMRRVDAVVAISSSDAASFEEMAGVLASVVPQVVPVTRTPWEPRGPRAVYVGNLSWHPNVAGLDWFCERVWPLVRDALPSAELDVVGSGLPRGEGGEQIVPDRWKKPGITVHGFVADLEPLYLRSSAFVAPILGGSGVRIKLLEGFRAGLPLVTTPAGALGLPIASGREALVAGAPGDFARDLVRLLCDVELQRSLREGAYTFLEREHGLAAAQAVAREVLGLGP